jgi:hypothetical protein
MTQVKSGEFDAVLYLPEQRLLDRFDGNADDLLILALIFLFLLKVMTLSAERFHRQRA